MKTTTLLLGIAIATSQVNPLVCMDETGFISTESSEEAQLTRYTYQNFYIDHFSLRIGVDPNQPYDINEILDDLFTQREYVSSITATNPDFDLEAVDAENAALIKCRDDFFTKLAGYQSNDTTVMVEVGKYDDPIAWIMHQVPFYNKDAESILVAFANKHNLHR